MDPIQDELVFLPVTSWWADPDALDAFLGRDLFDPLVSSQKELGRENGSAGRECRIEEDALSDVVDRFCDGVSSDNLNEGRAMAQEDVVV